MPNDYFNHSANVIASGIRALAAQVNNIATEIATGLDLLPTTNQLKYQTSNYGVDTGAADAYVVSAPFAAAPFVLTDGMEVQFKAITQNTGASTLNLNALGAKSLINPDGTALTAVGIRVGQMCTARYNLTTDSFQLISANSSFPVPVQNITQTPDAFWTISGTNMYGGTNAGVSLTSGTQNTLAGDNAGNALADGHGNTAVGSGAAANVVSASYTTAFGFLAGQGVVTGAYNVAVGYNSMVSGDPGNDNIALGHNAYGLLGNVTNFAHHNIAIGEQSLASITGGDNNIAIGELAMYSQTSGSDNIAVGASAGTSITAGGNNICIGAAAGPTSDDSGRICIDSSGSATNVPMIGGDADADTVSFAPDSTNIACQFDDDGTAGNTRFLVYDVDNATLERVTVGAADSGGAGYKVLRIPN